MAAINPPIKIIKVATKIFFCIFETSLFNIGLQITDRNNTNYFSTTLKIGAFPLKEGPSVPVDSEITDSPLKTRPLSPPTIF